MVRVGGWLALSGLVLWAASGWALDHQIDAGFAPDFVASPDRVSGLAAADAGTFYYVSEADGLLYRSNRDGSGQQPLPMTQGGSPLVLNQPAGMAVGSNGWLYIVDSGADRWLALNGDQELVFDTGGTGTLPGQFNWPLDLAVSSDTVAVSDPLNNRVQLFSAVDGSFIREYRSHQPFGLALTSPAGVAFGADGTLFIAEPATGLVHAIAPDGSSSRQISGGGLMEPFDLAVDRLQRLHVLDTSQNRVFVYDEDDALLGSYAASDVGEQALPYALAISELDIYVSEATTPRIHRIGEAELRRVPEPEFQLEGGLYYVPQMVTVASGSLGGEVRYTTDGSAPTDESPLFPDPYEVPFDTTVELSIRGFKAGMTPSGTVTATYRVTGTVATPMASVPAGLYQEPQTVELLSAAESEVIHYTLDGSDPLGSGQVYDEPLLLEEDTEVTLRAVASRPDWLPSAELTVDYRITGTLQPPTFSQPAGAYTESVVLQLDAARASSEIRFTVDGSEPGPQSAEYVEPIALPMNSTTTVRARALEEDWISSETASATYHIYPPLEASADDEPLLDTTVDLVSGEELTFTVNGGEGDYQVTVEPNAAGVSGSIEHLGNGEYRFVAPDTGAFAGEYTVRITDPVTGWTGDFTVRVPLAIAAERSTLLGVHPELRDAAIVVRGASPGAMISLAIDGDGVSALDPAPAEDLPAQGNPATILVRAAEVENDPASVEATATAVGLPDSEPLELTALVGVVYRGELTDTWPQPLEGVQVLLREDGDSYTHPELGSLDVLSGEGGDFLLAAPASAGARELLFRAPEMLDEVLDAGDCLGENGCAVQMSYLGTAAAPAFGLPGGVYTTPELADGLTLSGEGLIRYTLDDADVTVDAVAYDLPLLLPAGQSTTVRARAYVERQNPSAESVATYHVYPPLNVEFEGEPVESLTVGHGDSLTFQLDGGSGDWEVTAATNAAGLSGTLEQTVDGWRFTAPDQGAFAGRYTITVRDRVTGAETVLHVEVPLAVSAPRKTLLGVAPQWRELSLTVAGAEPGVTLYAVSSDAQAATVQNSAVASDDAAAGNPALILVTAIAGVSADSQFTVGVSADGGLEGVGPELLAMRGVVYVGEVEDTWARTLQGAEIVLQDGDAAYEHPELGSFSTQTDAQGRFELPAPRGDYQLRVSAVGLEPAVRPVADCDSLNGCLVQLEYAETAAAPVLAPPPGTYLPGQIADGVILGGEGILRYTVDGLPVSMLASRYENPIHLASAATTEVRARAYEEGRNPSPEVGGAYLVYPEAIVSIDGAPVAAPELLPAGQSLSFQLEGGSGEFELHAQPNAQGVNGQLEQLSADQWVFHAPDSGAFAGTYRIVVTDLLTGRTTTLSVDVPLVLEVSANALLAGADGRNNAYVTARGLHEGASFALSLTTDPGGQEDTVTVLSTGNPHRHLVVVGSPWSQAGVIELTGTSPGIEPGLAEIAVERPVMLSGSVTTLYGWIYTARLQLVRVDDAGWEPVLDALGEPFETYTAINGLFTLATPPAPPGTSYKLLVTSDGYAAHFEEASACDIIRLCFIYLTLEEQVASPRISLPGGQFSEPREVTLESTTADATIRYTLDGSDPVEGNGITGPSGLRITLSRTTTIRARAEKAGLVASETVQAEFRFRPAQDGGFFDGRDNEGRGGLGSGGGGGAFGPWTLLLLLLAGAARLGWYGRSGKQR